MTTLTLAWRNLWRNRRRTLITMASVVMAVMLSALMGSMQQGQYDQMIDNTVGTFSGHLQIQAEGYHDEPSLDRSLELDAGALETLKARPDIRAVVPRLDTYALAAGADRSRAAMVVGIDVRAEDALSAPRAKVSAGRYFAADDEYGALVAEGLAQFLNIGVGDTLVLLGSGYQGMSASGAFPVVGLVRFGLPDLNRQTVYLPIAAAQEMTGAYGRLTSVAVLVHSIKDASKIAESIGANLPEGLVALDWQTLMPDLVQAIQADYGSSIIILLILYMVVGFGIFGTVLMMTAERRFEFGVMNAIGTSKRRIVGMLLVETSCITFMGTLVGIGLSLPVMLYFNRNPLKFAGEAAAAIVEYGMEPYIRFSLDASIPLTQGFIVLAITLLIGLYPIWHLRKLKPVEAMRH